MQRQTFDGVVCDLDAHGIARIVLDRPGEANTTTRAASTAFARAVERSR